MFHKNYINKYIWIYLISTSCIHNHQQPPSIIDSIQNLTYKEYIKNNTYNDFLEININKIIDKQEKLITLLKLMHSSLISKPQLALQYLQMIKNINLYKDLEPIINLAQKVAYANLYNNVKELELSLINLDLNIIKSKNFNTIKKELINISYKICIKHLFNSKEYQKILNIYNSYNNIFKYPLQDPEILMLIALTNKKLANYNEYIKTLEELASYYPQHHYSKIAFKNIHILNKQKKYYPSLSFLKKLSLNIPIEPSITNFIEKAIVLPIRNNNKITTLSIEQQIIFILSLRLPSDVYIRYANKLNKLNKNNNKSDNYKASLLILQSNLYSKANDFKNAKLSLKQYINEFPKGIRINLVKEKLARIYKKEGDFKTASKIYEELFLKKYITAHTGWEYFLCTYLSKNYKKAIQVLDKVQYVLKEKNNDVSLDPLILKYWYAKTLENLNDKINAQQLYIEIIQQNPYSYYSYLIYTYKKDLIKSYNIKIPHLTLLANNDLSDTNTQIFINAKNYNKIYSDLIKSIQIHPALIEGIISIESNFKNTTISHMGAMGLMQIIPSTAISISKQLNTDHFFNIKDLFNPIVNICYGSYYIQYLKQKYNNNLILILSAYNAGENKTDEWIKYYKNVSMDELVELIPYKETRQYVKKVINASLKNILTSTKLNLISYN